MKKVVKDVEAVVPAPVKEAAQKAGKRVKKVAADMESGAKKVAADVESGAKKAAATTDTVVKKAAKAAAARKPVKETIYLQYLGKEINKDDIIKEIKTVWTKQMKRKVGEMKSVTLYLKPEENKVYYVINSEVTGSVEL